MSSMKRFAGFPDRMQYTPVPNLFFSSVLAEIDDLAELKVTLHLFRALYEKRGFPRMVRLSDLSADRVLLLALRSPEGKPPEQRLIAALDRACARGTFLGVALQGDESGDRCYFLNNALNRDLLKQVERGERRLAEGTVTRVEWATLPEQRPTIYDLYEQNIGMITPLIAEELQQAEEAYPPEWIEDAFREAVSYNKRNWRYVRRILENWATKGRGEDGKGRRHSKGSGSPSKYVEGKYAHILQR
ncbi:MAG: DnaD domain-containing protein [Chloroflexota bacterium]|jgi:DNA replication protein